MPEEWYLIRADNSRRINRIYVIYSKFQNIDTVATEAVRAIVVIYARLGITRAVPVVVLTGIHMMDEAVRIRLQYVQRQNNYRVATEVMEGVAIDTCLCQYTVAEGVTAAFADVLSNTNLYIVFYRQVQDILYAVVSLGVILNRLDIAIRLIELMVAPSVRQLTPTNRCKLLMYNHLQVCIYCDDTVATRRRLIFEIPITACCCKLMLAISSREVREGDTLCLMINRIDRQLQDINRVNTLCRIVINIYGIIPRAAVEIVVSAPCEIVTLADRLFRSMGVRHRSRSLVTYT